MGHLSHALTVAMGRENPDEDDSLSGASLCEAAEKVLKSSGGKKPEADTEEMRQKKEALRLGTCRELGDFPSSEWKDDARMPDFMWDGEHFNDMGKYYVLDLTLIDGNDEQKKLIGVINGGDADANSGVWGSVYLMPGFEEIGGIISTDEDSVSKWEISDASWYTPPATPLPRNRLGLCGGPDSTSPLETHLSHALTVAMGWGNPDAEEE